jgi:hypothetical protein
MVWLGAYAKPVTRYKINTKIYPHELFSPLEKRTEKSYVYPENKKFLPKTTYTTTYTYTVVRELIDIGYVDCVNDKYFSTPKPILQLIEERLKSKNDFLYNSEREILSEFLQINCVRGFIGSLAEESDIYLEKQINAYELCADWISVIMFSYKQGKEEAKNEGKTIPPSAELNINDFKRRIPLYVKSSKAPDLNNEFNKIRNKLSSELDFPLPAVQNVDFDGLVKVMLALPESIVEKVSKCIKDEWKGAFLVGRMAILKRNDNPRSNSDKN